MQEVLDARSEWGYAKYEEFGESIGKALKKVIIGKPKDTATNITVVNEETIVV